MKIVYTIITKYYYLIQLATQGAAFNEGERLAQELQIIEAGIREKEKDVRNWNPYYNVPSVQPVNYVSDQTIDQSVNNPMKDVSFCNFINHYFLVFISLNKSNVFFFFFCYQLGRLV